MRYVKIWALVLAAFITFAARAIDIDQTTPKAAALSFMKAIEAGDASAKDITIGNEQDQELLSVMVQFSGSVKHLREVSAKKFGDKADEVTGGGLNMDSAKALESADIK